MSSKPPAHFPNFLLIAGGVIFFFCLWGFLEIAEDYPEGRYLAVDAAILRAFRTPDHLAIPRGPLWLQDVMRDLTALGGPAVLGLVFASATGFLALQRKWQNALGLLAVGVGGVLLNTLLKAIAARPRPDVVPHLVEVTSSSFPSGHSMLSAIIYVSLGTMLAREFQPMVLRVYVIAIAAFLAFAVGVSRVYLGVHFPSDVAAGWTAGVAWTLLCTLVLQLISRRRHPGARP